MNFGRAMAAYAKKTNSTLRQAGKAVVFETFRGIIMDTPVDTGRLRGNFQITPGQPATSEIDREDKSGNAVVAELSKNIDPVGVTCMANMLPYAGRRNREGGKGGKGALFVEKNIARVERNMIEAVKGIK